MNTSRRRFSRIIIPAVLLLSVVVAVVLVLTKPQAKTADAREVARDIDILTAAPGSHAPTVPVFVRVTTPNHASLRAAITADVIKLLALDGNRVESGEPIILLDEREARLAVQQREADLQEAISQIEAEKLEHEKQLFVIRNDKGERARQNREQIIKSHKIRLQGLEARKLRATSALELARLDLQRTRITAPFTGQITTLHVSVGDRVRPGDQLVELFDREAIELTGSISARYLPALQSALNTGLVLTAHGMVNNQPVKAILERLSGEVNPGSGGVNAIFRIAENAHFLPLGRSLKLDLGLPAEENTLVIPNTALYGMDKVYKVIDRRLKGVAVTRLGDFPDRNGIAQSLITSPEIQQGDSLMITQLPNAVDNLLVNPADNTK